MLIFGLPAQNNMISRDEALELIRKYVRSDKLVKHMIAVESIMRALARRLGEDESLWGLVGLLHDVDYELTQSDFSKHGIVSTETILKGRLPEQALSAIRAHNEMTDHKDDSKLALALRAADQVSGLIVATALVMPSKRLSEVKLETLKRKFKQKDFARGVDREKIRLCERIGLSLDEFLDISLKAMQSVSDKLGL